jgi:hypothetical protein
MKKILLLTAILVAALTVNAWAVNEGSGGGDDSNAPITSGAVVTLDNPGVFQGTFSLLAPVIQIDESEVIANNAAAHYHSGTPGGTFFYSTNLNDTRIKVERTAFSYVGEGGYPGGDYVGGSYGLFLHVGLSAGVGPQTGLVQGSFGTGDGAYVTTSVQDIVVISDGDSQRTATFTYAIDGVDITDDPGDYTSTVTYTMYDN